jgi:hypothetical protein
MAVLWPGQYCWRGVMDYHVRCVEDSNLFIIAGIPSVRAPDARAHVALLRHASGAVLLLLLPPQVDMQRRPSACSHHRAACDRHFVFYIKSFLDFKVRFVSHGRPRSNGSAQCVG